MADISAYQPPTPPYDLKIASKEKSISHPKVKTTPSWKWLPNTVWDKLVVLLSFNSRVQVSLVCKDWRIQSCPYLWRKPSRRWFADILRRRQFIKSITEHRHSIRTFDSIPVCPDMLSQAIQICSNIEALVLNCSQPYVWDDQKLISILSIPSLTRSLKHLIIYDISQDFSSWRDLTQVVSKLRALTLITLPAHFPYNTYFQALPSSLRFLNCSVNEESFESLASADLHNFLGLSIIFFDLEQETSIGKLLLSLKKITTLSLEGTGSIVDLNYLNSPRILTGLKIKIYCQRDDLQNLLRKCRSLEHVELCHSCCDDRVLRLLTRHNRKLSVLKIKNTSITTVGITFIFKSKSRIKQLDLESQTDHCGPYKMELKKCLFLDKLTHLRICLTLYTTLKILNALRFMTSLSYLDLSLHPHQLGSLDCHSLFSPTPPYLAFFPIMTQMEHFLTAWPNCFNFNSSVLTSFSFRINGNPTLLAPFQNQIKHQYVNTLSKFPCLIYPLLIFNDQTLYPGSPSTL